MFEVWRKITEEIDMNPKLLILVLSTLLISCSSSDDSFTLVCDVNSETTTVLGGGSAVKDKEKETVTWIFKNKKIDVSNNLDIYQCTTWTKEEIGCDYNHKTEKSNRTESIRINRMSGSISYYRLHHEQESKTGQTKTYKGKCEKTKEGKF